MYITWLIELFAFRFADTSSLLRKSNTTSIKKANNSTYFSAVFVSIAINKSYWTYFWIYFFHYLVSTVMWLIGWRWINCPSTPLVRNAQVTLGSFILWVILLGYGTSVMGSLCLKLCKEGHPRSFTTSEKAWDNRHKLPPQSHKQTDHLNLASPKQWDQVYIDFRY